MGCLGFSFFLGTTAAAISKTASAVLSAFDWDRFVAFFATCFFVAAEATFLRFLPALLRVTRVAADDEAVAAAAAFVAVALLPCSFETIFFGHIGDGNIHMNILKPDGLTTNSFYKECEKVTEMVFGLVQEFGGRISAEHGIGVLKKPYLRYSRGKEEITYMKAVKRMFDPNNIMNPGKLMDLE